MTSLDVTWPASANIAVYPVDLSALDFSTSALPSSIYNQSTSSANINNTRGSNGLKSAMRIPYDQAVQKQLTLRGGSRTARAGARASPRTNWKNALRRLSMTLANTICLATISRRPQNRDGAELAEALMSPVEYTGLRLNVQQLQNGGRQPGGVHG
jgi:hypothetical protein